MNEPVLRNALLDDVPAITTIYNHFVANTPITFDLETCSLENRQTWFKQFSETGPYRLLVAESDGVIAGYACTTRFRMKPAYDISVESTIYVDPDHMGKGLGRKLYSALFTFLESEEIYRVYGGITLPNPESIALHEHFGFDHVGTFHGVGRKFDQLWDVAWYEKRLKS